MPRRLGLTRVDDEASEDAGEGDRDSTVAEDDVENLRANGRDA